MATFWISWEVRKPSKKLRNGTLALDGGKVSHRREVHDLLDVALGEHGEAGLAAGHDVGVVAEDVQGVGGDATGGDVEDARQLLARDLVHVRDHQEQALRSRVGGGQSAGAQRAVNGTGGAASDSISTTLTGVPKMFLRPWAPTGRHGRPWGWTA